MKKHRFKVLLSYSGSQSMGVAEAIRDLLELVLPSVKPWVASIDIEAGQRWQEVLTDTLKVSTLPESRTYLVKSVS